MKELFWNTISENMHRVMMSFAEKRIGAQFYLAGGTALAFQKDFVDLYMICQRIPLRSLLDMAPKKYSFARDFESQVIRRLVYFEHADVEEPVSSIHSVEWEEIKNYFRELAVSIGRSWLM